MIEDLVKAVNIPVSVKMRLGFYDDEDLITTAKNFESSGIASLAIHGRTTLQKFKGQAAWEKIYEVKENISIPVIGNGDITSAKIGVNKIKNLDGIMIGRQAVKNPWIFKQCRELFDGKEMSEKPSLNDQMALFEKHAELAIAFKDERWAMIEMRKHFSHFIRGIHGATGYRERLIRVESHGKMKAIFDEIRKEQSIFSNAPE